MGFAKRLKISKNELLMEGILNSLENSDLSSCGPDRVDVSYTDTKYALGLYRFLNKTSSTAFRSIVQDEAAGSQRTNMNPGTIKY